MPSSCHAGRLNDPSRYRLLLAMLAAPVFAAEAPVEHSVWAETAARADQVAAAIAGSTVRG
jgi:hypothetical protein